MHKNLHQPTEGRTDIDKQTDKETARHKHKPRQNRGKIKKDKYAHPSVHPQKHMHTKKNQEINTQKHTKTNTQTHAKKREVEKNTAIHRDAYTEEKQPPPIQPHSHTHTNA